MINRLRNSLNELRASKLYMMSFIVYVCWEFAIGVEFCQRCYIITYTEEAKFYNGYPAECSDFARGVCVRTDLKNSECRGQ